jgi:hypothetical protein
LHTFGRVMPVLMTLSMALAIANASVGGGNAGPGLWRWLGAGFLVAALVSTVIVNVPINLATGRWDPHVDRGSRRSAFGRRLKTFRASTALSATRAVSTMRTSSPPTPRWKP